MNSSYSVIFLKMYHDVKFNYFSNVMRRNINNKTL